MATAILATGVDFFMIKTTEYVYSMFWFRVIFIVWSVRAFTYFRAYHTVVVEVRRSVDEEGRTSAGITGTGNEIGIGAITMIKEMIGWDAAILFYLIIYRDPRDFQTADRTGIETALSPQSAQSPSIRSPSEFSSPGVNKEIVTIPAERVE